MYLCRSSSIIATHQYTRVYTNIVRRYNGEDMDGRGCGWELVFPLSSTSVLTSVFKYVLDCVMGSLAYMAFRGHRGFSYENIPQLLE
jgi:hypothetical protein